MRIDMYSSRMQFSVEQKEGGLITVCFQFYNGYALEPGECRTVAAALVAAADEADRQDLLRAQGVAKGGR